MEIRRILLAVPAALLALGGAPARATSVHDYAKDEYAIIRNGLAPSGRLSVASHGEGELGGDNFHVWLMAEPGHRRIVALDDIGSDNNLDSDADAYHAFWSANSRHVAVAFRSSRHEVQLNLYRIEGRRPHEMTGPSLFREVTSREIADGDDMRQRISTVDWHAGNRFKLREYQTFIGPDDRLAKLFGSYGRVTEKLDDGKLVIEFSAEAECEWLPGDRYRVIDLRPGKSGTPDWWYSP